jgi:hypothetical protein
MNEIEYRKLWAKSKPYLPLLFHMVDVGNVTKTLLSEKSVFEGVGERLSNILNIENTKIHNPRECCYKAISKVNKDLTLQKLNKDYSLLVR